MTTPVLVVAALRAEVADLIARMAVTHRGRVGHAGYVRGTIEGIHMAVGWTGDGSRAAHEGLEALLGDVPAQRILVLGLAGGLSDDLDVGDLVVASRVFDESGEAPAPAGFQGPDGVDDQRAAVFVSASRIAVTAGEKRALFARLGSLTPDVTTATVDLETAAFARVAAAHGLDYHAVRVISDTVDESLPVDFNRMRDVRGSVRSWKVALWAVGHPGAVPALNALKKRLDQGAARLADVGVSWVVREAA